MDVFTRLIRGRHLGRGRDGARTLSASERAPTGHRPEIHHPDQGVQYAATGDVDRLRQVEAQISMAASGAPRAHGDAERLLRTTKEEDVERSEYQDCDDAYRHLGRFPDAASNVKRIHAAPGYRTPLEFEAPWRRKQTA